jgi:glycosyltransferase involved in cell wall biosynthesis
MITDILCAVHNGARYLDAAFESLQAQTVHEWRCWVRDDGSTDDSAARIAAWSEREPRITLLHRGPPALGGAGAGSYSWLLTQLPADARVVALIDHDDVWHPERLARSLAALADAERTSAGAVLVHSDLEIVDADLRTTHPSFWRAAGIAVEPSDLRRVIVDNMVTTSTITMNRAVVSLVASQTPPTVTNPDAWFAAAAAAFGRIVALNTVTVRYRQHDGNAVGALARAAHRARSLATAVRRIPAERAQYRTDLERSCALAKAFAERFGDALSPGDRAFLEEYGALPSRGALARKFGVLRLRRRPGRTMLGALAEFVRA